jgi:hypothetical protein
MKSCQGQRRQGRKLGVGQDSAQPWLRYAPPPSPHFSESGIGKRIPAISEWIMSSPGGPPTPA